MAVQGPDLIEMSQLREILGKSKREFSDLRRSSDFPAPVKSGRQLLWHQGDIEAWLEKEPAETPDQSESAEDPGAAALSALSGRIFDHQGQVIALTVDDLGLILSRLLHPRHGRRPRSASRRVIWGIVKSGGWDPIQGELTFGIYPDNSLVLLDGASRVSVFHSEGLEMEIAVKIRRVQSTAGADRQFEKFDRHSRRSDTFSLGIGPIEVFGRRVTARAFTVLQAIMKGSSAYATYATSTSAKKRAEADFVRAGLARLEMPLLPDATESETAERRKLLASTPMLRVYIALLGEPGGEMFLNQAIRDRYWHVFNGKADSGLLEDGATKRQVALSLIDLWSRRGSRIDNLATVSAVAVMTGRYAPYRLHLAEKGRR